MPRRSREWYIANGKPVPETFERKTYNWYVQRGLTPPANLKVPKVIKSFGTNVVSLQTQTTFTQEIPADIAPQETDGQIEARIKMRFEVLETLVADVVNGDMLGLIVSGPPGLGKSYTVEYGVKEVERCRIVKGHASAKALYELLYKYKEEGDILVFDDADSIFTDERGLNLLKTALDTTETRVLSWLTGSSFGRSGVSDGEDDSEGQIPDVFTYEGSIIFITNLDFDGLIARGNKIAKHLEALVSRSHYIDLLMKSRREFIIRIKQVVKETNMLGELNKKEQADVITFIEENQEKLREVSLRTALKVATLRKSNDNWKDVAKITCCKI